MKKHKIIIGVTGASGAIYAKSLLDRLVSLEDQIEAAGVVFSDYAREVWQYELSGFQADQIPFPVFSKDDFFAPFASGSSGYETMIICPCSMGTLSAIAHGSSRSLIERAADVMLKERRKLVVVPRETPLSEIHLRNMLTLAQADVVVMPAAPGFYGAPQGIDDLVDFIVARVLDQVGIEHDIGKRWSGE